ncbi:MAG: hypothetical protein ACOC2E_00210 [Bacteroidota bacterium]
MLKKDNWILGIVMGGLMPLVIYLLILGAMKQWGTVNEQLEIYYLKKSTMLLIGIFSNLFTFRYYMVNLKYDKTGRGILLTTFVYAGIFFYQNLK